jgi:hypothetical protein
MAPATYARPIAGSGATTLSMRIASSARETFSRLLRAVLFEPILDRSEHLLALGLVN